MRRSERAHGRGSERIWARTTLLLPSARGCGEDGGGGGEMYVFNWILDEAGG